MSNFIASIILILFMLLSNLLWDLVKQQYGLKEFLLSVIFYTVFWSWFDSNYIHISQIKKKE